MDNKLTPIEAFVQQGLAQRFHQIFNSPLMYSNADDKRSEAARLVKRGMKYPFAFASVTADEITENTYRPHTLMRRGLLSGVSADGMLTQRLNLIPVTTEYEITYMAQSLQDIRKFSRYWLLGVAQNALKFSVTYGVVDLDINVTPEKRVNIPRREGGLNEAKQYEATVNVTVQGYMSNEELKKAQVVNEIQGDWTVEEQQIESIQADVQTLLQNFDVEQVYMEVPVSQDGTSLIDISLPKTAFDLVLYENRVIGFAGGNIGLDGKKFTLRVTQGFPGGFGITWDTNTVNFGGDIESFSLTQAVGMTDYLGFIYRHASRKCDLIAFARNYA